MLAQVRWYVPASSLPSVCSHVLAHASVHSIPAGSEARHPPRQWKHKSADLGPIGFALGKLGGGQMRLLQDRAPPAAASHPPGLFCACVARNARSQRSLVLTLCGINTPAEGKVRALARISFSPPASRAALITNCYSPSTSPRACTCSHVRR